MKSDSVGSSDQGKMDGGEGGEKFVHCAMLGDGMVGKTCMTLSYTQKIFTHTYTATVFDNYSVPLKVGGQDFVISLFDTAGQSDYESVRAYTYQESEVLVLCFSVCDRESYLSVVNSWLPEIRRHTKRRRPLLLVGTQIDLRNPDLGSPNSPGGVNSPNSPTAKSPSTPNSPVAKSPPSGPNSPSSPKSPSSSPNSPKSPTTDDNGNASASWGPLSTSGDQVTTDEGRHLAKVIGADCYIECSARSQEGLQQVFEHVVFSALKYRRKKGRFLSRLFGDRMSSKAIKQLAAIVNNDNSGKGHLS